MKTKFIYNNKVYKLKIYNKAITNLIYDIKQQQVIEDKIYNLKIYYTWKYEKLLISKKIIKYKKIFRVKYNFNGNIKRFEVYLVTQKFSQIYKIHYIKIITSILYLKFLKIFLAFTIA